VLLIQTNDVSWYLAQLGLWAIAELSIATICSCLPTMPKLYQSIRRRFTGRSSSSGPRTPKSLSKGTSTSASSEKPARSHHMNWLRTTTTTYSQTDELERNAPQHIEHHAPKDPRSLPPSSQRYIAELDAQEHIPRTYQVSISAGSAAQSHV
jgi:hypothetical protein